MTVERWINKERVMRVYATHRMNYETTIFEYRAISVSQVSGHPFHANRSLFPVHKYQSACKKRFFSVSPIDFAFYET